jgi:hypothetical protein
VQLGELVAAPRLKLRVLHEPRGAMQRQVGRVVTTDLLDSARYLSGGELVTTGLVWRRSPEDSERFVQGLVDAGTIALAAGDAQFGSIPEDLVEACRRHGLPLLEVPVEVAFADVAEYVAAHGVPGSGARLSATVGRQRQLLNAIASGRSLDELVERVSRDAGRTCRIISPTGRHVVPGPSPLEADDLDRVTAAFLEADRLPVAVTAGGAPYSLFTVGSGLGNRIAAWILVADGDWAEWQQEEVEAVNELAAIAALDRSRRQEGLRAVQHIADEALALVTSEVGSTTSAPGCVRRASSRPVPWSPSYWSSPTTAAGAPTCWSWRGRSRTTSPSASGIRWSRRTETGGWWRCSPPGLTVRRCCGGRSSGWRPARPGTRCGSG